LLVSIFRSVGRRFAVATVALALALAVPSGAVATAAPPAPPAAPEPSPGPPAKPTPAPAAEGATSATTPAPAAAGEKDWKQVKREQKQAKKAQKKANAAEKKRKKAEKKAQKQASKAAKKGKADPAAAKPTAGGTPSSVATPASGGSTATPAVVARPDPAEPEASALQVLPLEVEGKLGKDSQRTLADRLQAAAVAAKTSGGPYRLRLSVRLSGKRDYALALAVLGEGDATVAAPSDVCKACSLDQVATRIDALVQQATAELAAKEPPSPPAAVEVSVTSVPLGARVRIDGEERGLTPQTLALPPGEHTVLVDKPGFLEREQEIVVEPGAEQALEIELVAQPAAGRGASEGTGRALKIAGAVVLGLGVVGAGVGVGMIFLDEEPIQSRCTGADVDFRGVCRHRYDTLTGGIVGAAAGGLGIAGGLAMLIQGQRITVRARASKQQASLGLVVRF
jgi:flagellar motor protein MotB